MESEDSDEGVVLREERSHTPAVRNFSSKSVGKQGVGHVPNVLLSRESVDSDGTNILSEPAEALETEERLRTTTSELTLPVGAPNAGQHSNV